MPSWTLLRRTRQRSQREVLLKHVAEKVEKSWSSTKDRGPGVSSKGDLVVSGLQLSLPYNSLMRHLIHL